jgi:hypothetical protein
VASQYRHVSRPNASATATSPPMISPTIEPGLSPSDDEPPAWLVLLDWAGPPPTGPPGSLVPVSPSRVVDVVSSGAGWVVVVVTSNSVVVVVSSNPVVVVVSSGAVDVVGSGTRVEVVVVELSWDAPSIVDVVDDDVVDDDVRSSSWPVAARGTATATRNAAAIVATHHHRSAPDIGGMVTTSHALSNAW